MKAIALEVATFDLAKVSKAEANFCRAQLHFHYVDLARRGTWCGLVFNAASFFIDRIIAEPEAQAILFWAHIVFIGLSLFALRIFKREMLLRRVVYAGILAHVTVYAAVVRIVCGAQGQLVVKSTTTLIAMEVIFTLFSTLEGRPLVALAGAVSLMTALAVAGQPFAPQYIFVHCLAVAIAVLFHRIKSAWTMHIASRSFKVKTMIAPAHIVERSTGREGEIEELFAPARAHCVCICIQWRNFEELARTVPAETLSAALSRYFVLVERLLTESIHGGAYYCDAMVDEMFVIVFSPAAAGDTLPLTDAVLFARRLLRERGDEREVPSQIDIGIASGDTLLGILGPKGHRKTTGLGETPGRAARLKQVGELLRRERGDLDRLIIDAASQTMLTGQSGFIKLALGGERRVRDLDDAHVYFWEHKPNTVLARPA